MQPHSLPVIILHGWSDDAKSFAKLAKWLKGQGFDIVDIYLCDYLSMNDEITLYDLGYAFCLALKKHNIPQTKHSFDLIVHSTGGLVAREYLRQHCRNAETNEWDVSLSPVQHLCMLAPANFGSPLAKLGKSVLGRFLKGWKWEHAGQTGQHVLDALELASPYSWQLAEDDLFNPGFPIFAPENVFTTVMVGTLPYKSQLRSVLHENGSDGTVRVSTANLNASCYVVDFPSASAKPVLTPRKHTAGEMAFAVFHRDHTTIHDPHANDPEESWKNTILNALNLQPQDYPQHAQRCSEITEATYKQGLTSVQASTKEEWYHQYQHVVFRVRDQFGEPVTDYVVEFYDEADKANKITKFIHTEVVEKVTKNEQDGSCRSFLLDITDLDRFLANPARRGTSICISISAVAISRRIKIDYPEHGFGVFGNDDKTFWHPNEPVLVDVTLHRLPGVSSRDNVFRIART